MFLILRIIKCMLEALLCHFSYLSWIWERYTKYLPLGNYIFHLSTQKKVLCFQLSYLHKIFMCFGHKASIFPSSWSSLWCLFQPHMTKIEGRANMVECFSKEKCLAGLSEKWSISCAFYKPVSPFPFVAAVPNQPTDEDGGFVHAGDWCLLFIYRPLLLLCNAACSTLKKHPLFWIITHSILFLLSIDLHKTASRSSLITMKNSSTNAWQESWDYP